MMSYSDRWADEGERWRAIFENIDPLLSDIAARHGMSTTSWHRDAPDRLLQWIGPDGLERNIHLFLSADRSWVDLGDLVLGPAPPFYGLRFEGAIWLDRGRQRRLHQESWEHLTIERIEADTIDREQIRKNLETSYKGISNWTEADLDQVVMLS